MNSSAKTQRQETERQVELSLQYLQNTDFVFYSDLEVLESSTEVSRVSSMISASSIGSEASDPGASSAPISVMKDLKILKNKSSLVPFLGLKEK